MNTFVSTVCDAVKASGPSQIFGVITVWQLVLERTKKRKN